MLLEFNHWSNILVTKKNSHKIYFDLHTCTVKHIRMTNDLFVMNMVGVLLLHILNCILNIQTKKRKEKRKLVFLRTEGRGNHSRAGYLEMSLTLRQYYIIKNQLLVGIVFNPTKIMKHHLLVTQDKQFPLVVI